MEKEIRLLKKENDFLEEASAFFAASRLKSAKTKEVKFIALKTKTAAPKRNITFFCRVLACQQTGYYQYLVMKDRPWKYQPLADAMKDIITEDICNDTYGRTRMYLRH
ncbi:MAG: hypothetical protein ACLVAV_02560 [Clostridium sp.]